MRWRGSSMEASLLRKFTRFEELFELFRVVLKKTSEIGKNLNGVGAKMMFDAFDVVFLRLGVQSKKGKKAGERFVAFLDTASHALSLVCEHQPAIFFVIEVTQLAEFLHHAGDRRLFNLQRGGDVHDPGVAFFLDQLMNTLQVIFGTLTGGWWRGHVAAINHRGPRRRKYWLGGIARRGWTICKMPWHSWLPITTFAVFLALPVEGLG